MRRLRDDTRGLGTGVVLFVAAIVIGGLLFIVLDPAMAMLFDTASSQAQTTQAQEVIDLRERIWNAILYAVLFIAGLFVIARGIAESRRVG